MTKRFKLLFLLMFSIVIVACSFGGNDEAADQSSQNDTDTAAQTTDIGEAINVGYSASPAHLDSHASPSQQTADISKHIFETLVTVDSDYNVQPMLAESWEQSEDGLTLTFHL